MTKISPVLHNRIAVLRAERNLSRQDLADAVGINAQTVGFLERGDYNPSLALALDLSEFFALPIEAIFSRRPLEPLSTQVYAASRANGDKEGR
jgi:DNA-binding XRE family transcriptional regulator